VCESIGFLAFCCGTVASPAGAPRGEGAELEALGIIGCRCKQSSNQSPRARTQQDGHIKHETIISSFASSCAAMIELLIAERAWSNFSDACVDPQFRGEVNKGPRFSIHANSWSFDKLGPSHLTLHKQFLHKPHHLFIIITNPIRGFHHTPSFSEHPSKSRIAQ